MNEGVTCVRETRPSGRSMFEIYSDRAVDVGEALEKIKLETITTPIADRLYEIITGDAQEGLFLEDLESLCREADNMLARYREDQSFQERRDRVQADERWIAAMITAKSEIERESKGEKDFRSDVMELINSEIEQRLSNGKDSSFEDNLEDLIATRVASRRDQESRGSKYPDVVYEVFAPYDKHSLDAKSSEEVIQQINQFVSHMRDIASACDYWEALLQLQRSKDIFDEHILEVHEMTETVADNLAGLEKRVRHLLRAEVQHEIDNPSQDRISIGRALEHSQSDDTSESPAVITDDVKEKLSNRAQSVVERLGIDEVTPYAANFRIDRWYIQLDQSKNANDKVAIEQAEAMVEYWKVVHRLVNSLDKIEEKQLQGHIQPYHIRNLDTSLGRLEEALDNE
jgi:hypothetical protein